MPALQYSDWQSSRNTQKLIKPLLRICSRDFRNRNSYIYLQIAVRMALILSPLIHITNCIKHIFSELIKLH